MITDAIAFILRNLPAVLLVVALLVPTLRRNRTADRFLSWVLLLPIGVLGGLHAGGQLCQPRIESDQDRSARGANGGGQAVGERGGLHLQSSTHGSVAPVVKRPVDVVLTKNSQNVGEVAAGQRVARGSERGARRQPNRSHELRGLGSEIQ